MKLIVFVLATFSVLGCTEDEVSRKPNIILIFIDDMGWSDLYNIVDDPGETSNLVTVHPKITKTMTTKVISWYKSMPR